MFYAILLFIFYRPFISSLSFPVLNSAYSTIFLLFLIIWTILKREGIQKNLPAKLKPPLILFILSLIVSTLFSQNKTHSLQEFPQYLIGLLLFMLPFSLSPKNKKLVLSAIILAGLGISLLAIYQYLFGFEYILDYLAKENTPSAGLITYLSQRRAFLPFISPNTLAGYLIMIIPLSLAFKKRIFFILPLGLALLLTKSLGALFSLFIGSMLYFYLNNQKGRRKIALLCGFSVIILLIFLLRQNSGSQFNQPGFSLLRRWDYWKETVEIIKLFPFLGVGLGALHLSQVRYAHNCYLQIWAEMGIFGIASFFWLIAETYSLINPSTPRSKDRGLLRIDTESGVTFPRPKGRGLNAAECIKRDFLNKKNISVLSAAIFTFIIHNLVDFTFSLPETSFIWWIIFGTYISLHEPKTTATFVDGGGVPVTLS